MQLRRDQKVEMLEQGFVRIEHGVPETLCDGALGAINHSLGQGLPREDLDAMRARSYCPELQGNAVITDLFHRSVAREAAESLIGVGRIRAVERAQIALRFPSEQRSSPPAPRPHIDGMHSPSNGVPKGQVNSFTMLVGVFLSRVSSDFAGNFAVWPGSHTLYGAHFQAHGAEALLDGMPRVDLPAPKQLRVEPGDVVLAHYLLGHGAALNVSPHVRYAIFFRLYHVDHDRMKWESMKNPWMEWEGMRESVSAS